EVHAGPATMDLGPESPAVVNHVVHRRLTAVAVPATLLDLAARGWAEVFAPHEGATMVRLRAVPPAGAPALTSYESQLLDAVRKVAGDADLRADRLAAALNPSTPWFWARFRMSVTRESKALGLVDRPKTARLLLTADIAPFVLCAGLALINPGLLGVGIPLLFILWPIAWYLAIRKAPDLLTPKGREVASRWLGVRAFIHGTGSLDDLPPAAVTVWDRYLAYGAAMDLSETAVEGLLMHFRTDMKVSDVMSVGHSIFDPNALGGIITEQMAQMHADKLHDLGFTAAAPFGPDAGDFCVLARSTERGLSAGIPGWGADFPQWAQALARRADALRASAPPEIASAVWAVHDELEPMLTTLSHATSFQVVAPTLQGYQHVMASPTMKQHAEQIATYLRDQCHMIIDMERFNRS
ncbi:MAG TPA: hypothetical protein VK461_15750, partial [Acidimicrobiales bacterium]|nr:hypothetical protein [Acidimicrobiales bacterium]